MFLALEALDEPLLDKELVNWLISLRLEDLFDELESDVGAAAGL
jgi:hypothetical protein